MKMCNPTRLRFILAYAGLCSLTGECLAQPQRSSGVEFLIWARQRIAENLKVQEAKHAVIAASISRMLDWVTRIDKYRDVIQVEKLLPSETTKSLEFEERLIERRLELREQMKTRIYDLVFRNESSRELRESKLEIADLQRLVQIKKLIAAKRKLREPTFTFMISLLDRCYDRVMGTARVRAYSAVVCDQRIKCLKLAIIAIDLSVAMLS
jgi:hypothetical protein